jgi:hypothetical protein
MARSHSQCEVLQQDFLAMQLPESHNYARCVPRSTREEGAAPHEHRDAAVSPDLMVWGWRSPGYVSLAACESAIPINVSAGTTIRADPCHKEPLILVLAGYRYDFRLSMIAVNPLLISAARATEYLGADLDTAAHYVSAATGACRPHHLDRAFDPVKLHQPTVAPDLEGLVVFVAAYFANSHRSSR